MTMLKDLKLEDISYLKVLLKIIMSSEKLLWATDSDIKRCEEIRKLTTGQGEDYATGCSLGYEYLKRDYGLIAVNLSRQKDLDAHPKAIQEIELIGWLKNDNGEKLDGTQYMFILKTLEKIKETRLKFS